MGIAVKHVSRRMAERLGTNSTCTELAVAFYHLRELAEVRTLPAHWYQPVHRDGKVLCYIVGQGNFIERVLSATMTPRGVVV